MRDKNDLDCDFHMRFMEYNYFFYCMPGELILVLEIFNEKEDFMYQMFGVITTSQDTLDYWG